MFSLSFSSSLLLFILQPSSLKFIDLLRSCLQFVPPPFEVQRLLPDVHTCSANDSAAGAVFSLPTNATCFTQAGHMHTFCSLSACPCSAACLPIFQVCSFSPWISAGMRRCCSIPCIHQSCSSRPLQGHPTRSLIVDFLEDSPTCPGAVPFWPRSSRPGSPCASLCQLRPVPVKNFLKFHKYSSYP